MLHETHVAILELMFRTYVEPCFSQTDVPYRDTIQTYFMLKHLIDKYMFQFPIEMSMPWILTDHILRSKEPSMME